MQENIRVAIKPFILKFIAGQGYPVHHFVITKNSKYGIFLFNCLEKPTLKLINTVKNHQWAPPFTEVLNVIVSENFSQKKGNIICPERQLDFNKLVNYDFHEEFFRYVKNRVGKKGSINNAIMDFRDMYGITEDELSFKTIQRAFQRRNEAINAYKSA